jgi:orotate phosphoribosyltransferase
MKIASLLLNEKAVSLEPSKPFRYASGILSPIYCDNRILLTSPDSRK